MLKAFITECCVIHVNAKVKGDVLYAAYRAWCDASKERIDSRRSFGEQLTKQGLERYLNNGTWYRGIGLLSTATEGTEGTEPNSRMSSRSLYKSAGHTANRREGSVPSVQGHRGDDTSDNDIEWVVS